MNINDKIKEQRLEKGLTLKALGDLMGVDKAQIYNWETGKRNPKAEYLIKLSNVLQFDFVRYLEQISGQEDSTPPTPTKKTYEEARITEKNLRSVPLVNIFTYGSFMHQWGDSEYLEGLTMIPTTLPDDGNYLWFEVRGDSMSYDGKNSIEQGDYILARELQRVHWNQLYLSKVWAWVLNHKEQGVMVKQITWQDKNVITCHSLNPSESDFTVDLNDISQIFYMKELRKVNF